MVRRGPIDHWINPPATHEQIVHRVLTVDHPIIAEKQLEHGDFLRLFTEESRQAFEDFEIQSNEDNVKLILKGLNESTRDPEQFNEYLAGSNLRDTPPLSVRLLYIARNGLRPLYGWEGRMEQWLNNQERELMRSLSEKIGIESEWPSDEEIEDNRARVINEQDMLTRGFTQNGEGEWVRDRVNRPF